MARRPAPRLGIPTVVAPDSPSPSGSRAPRLMLPQECDFAWIARASRPNAGANMERLTAVSVAGRSTSIVYFRRLVCCRGQSNLAGAAQDRNLKRLGSNRPQPGNPLYRFPLLGSQSRGRSSLVRPVHRRLNGRQLRYSRWVLLASCRWCRGRQWRPHQNMGRASAVFDQCDSHRCRRGPSANAYRNR